MYSQKRFHQIAEELYTQKQNTITFQEISDYVNLSSKTLRKYWKAYNAYENCPDIFRTIMKPIRVFEEITPEAAYWLGYLMADGCMANNSSSQGARLMLECKIEDKEILEKFCEFLNIRKNRITIGHQGKSVALSLAESNFTVSPREFGIIPNKSYVENTVPEIILNNDELFLQYFKGLLDGDGTIHTAKGSLGLSILSNSKTMLEQCKNKLESLIPEPTSIWLLTKEKEKIPKATQNLYYIKIGTGRYAHSNIQYLYSHFYDNYKIILTRKEQLLKEMLTGSL